MTTTLVLGGPRSGKSRHAQSLLQAHPQVTFVATCVTPDPVADPDLTSRIARHQERRPQAWRTLETLDLTRALLSSRQPVVVDDLPSWVLGQFDQNDLWSNPHRARQAIDDLVDEFSVALRAVPVDVVTVSHDPAWVRQVDDPRERLYADLLAHVNQRVSAVSQRVHAIVGGRVLDLTAAPVVGAWPAHR